MSDSLPPEPARRIDALEAQPAAPDFDPLSWVWLALLGLVLPIVLLILGWNAG